MKMADSEKAEEFVDAECPSERFDEAQSATTSVQDEHLKTETTTSTSSPAREKEDDSPLYTEGEQSLLSLPCLMKELRRDSPESQQASTGSEKPASRHIYESDSSNPCMLSPSSSGHLADSDTLSSCAEGAGEETETKMEADPAKEVDRQTSGRKSRRSRSESEAPPNAMAAKKNRCQPAGASGPEKQINGKQAKVKGHRSQKHKERMRLLRQKREAAARKKYNLLQDSSTSDSELTCDSSTSSSSDDDDDTSGGSKTIKTDIPDGPPVVGHYDISDTDSNQESMKVEKVRPSVIKRELETLRGQDMALRSGCIRALSSVAGHAAVETSHKDGRQHKVQISIGSSDSEVEIVGVQENARCAHPCGGVIKSLSSWKDDHSAERSASANTTTTTQPPPQRWTCVSPQSSWVSPPEVVDLTLDEESSGHKHIP
ncbi:protein C18orf25 homolog isoform X1 [Hippocampus zosterae]|uniref:protein C18orf25 homolog isoform X1 n=1 Tax=Hippocampus zosterae TaxID=109293 RepID=UPI00223D64C7|nr:protein C18orf25 homolog isoform X1 [Hippocampus zosterae]